MRPAWRVQNVVAAVVLGLPAWVAGQALGPVADDVDRPLLPIGISSGDLELFGRRVYLFKADDGTDVIHIVGEFELHLDRRRYLASREAVLWMKQRRYNDLAYQHFEIFLWREASVVEPAGTLTSGPALFVTLNGSGKLTIGADATTGESSAGSAVYQEGLELRRLLAGGAPDDVESQPPLRVVEPGVLPSEERPRVRPAVYYTADLLNVGEVDGRQILTAIGDVSLFQGDRAGADPLELRADAAVIFLAAGAGEVDAFEPQEPEPGEEQQPRDLTAEGPVDDFDLGALGGDEALSQTPVDSVYLEGDVILTRGERMIRADQLYYDFANDRALVLDAVARAIEPKRNVPIYVRAGQVRQLSRTEFVAWDARISSSEFFTPHYHVGAKEVRFTDTTSRSITGVAAGLRAGTFEAWHTTFNLGGLPLLYWPYHRGEFKEGESPIRAARTGYSSDFGATFETEWRLFDLLGFERPPGFDSTLRLDYYTERGPAVGIDADYERKNYFGLYRGYYIHDDGNDSLGRYRDETPETAHRGRSTIRHRHYLPHDWQLTLEGSYISDRGFLEEYFDREFEEGKEQETLLYLKKQKNTWAFTLLAQWRILDWLTQTEHLPEAAFRVIAEPVADVGSFYSENRVGAVRYRPGDREVLEYIFIRPREDASETVLRADTRQELGVPLTLGPVKLVPFGSLRGSIWDDAPESGGTDRGFGVGGLRGSMYLSRVFPGIHSKLLDVDGIRHIIKPDLVVWGAASSTDKTELYPFTPNVEDIDDASGLSVGVRQRWQTRRGGPGRKRTVDVVTLDVEAGLFANGPDDESTNGFASYSRPENSIARNYVNAAVNWRINDSTAVLSEANIDLDDGQLDIYNLSLAAERSPRLSYVVGYRFIEEIDSSLFGFGANYRISEKHTVVFRESFDLDRGKTEEFTIGFLRKFPRWHVALTFDLNEADDYYGVSLSAWPEGLPRAGLGSRRFTGLAESTGIRPE